MKSNGEHGRFESLRTTKRADFSRVTEHVDEVKYILQALFVHSSNQQHHFSIQGLWT